MWRKHEPTECGDDKSRPSTLAFTAAMSVYISFSDDYGWHRIAATIREAGIPANATTKRAVPEDATGCARVGLAAIFSTIVCSCKSAW